MENVGDREINASLKVIFFGGDGGGGGVPPNGKVEVSSLTIHRFVSNK